MYRVLIVTIVFFYSYNISAQTVNGMVADNEHQPLIGAAIIELGTTNGAVTDLDGRFSLEVESLASKLIVSYAGYKPDTLEASTGDPMHIMLEIDLTELEEVTVTSSSTFIDNIQPIHNEVITEAELTKAACCNLSESFETNASVDVSFADAVTGTKMIRMLGLDGRYVQINRENMPHVRGLTGRMGLEFVPGTWIQSIDLGKGAGSVVNGYESMTGQINLELKKPESEKLYINAYGNSFGRMELNLNHASNLRDDTGMALLVHSHYFGNEVDGNNDGFMDLPKSRMINVLNRYKYRTDKWVSQIGIQLTRDERAGGQLGFGFEDDVATSSTYGYQSNTSRFEVFGKTGLLFPHKPYKGWGFLYSASITDIDGGFGRNVYEGKEKSLYTSIIYQNIIGNSKHQYKTGASLVLDSYDEVFADSTFSRNEKVPGVYYEYSFLPSDRLSWVAGFRVDFHNLYGDFYTPRMHLRYDIKEDLTFRLAAGRGYRVPNIIMENSQVLVSSRQLYVLNSPNPEVSWNTGISLVSSFNLGEKKVNWTADYFYTNFENQIIYDRDASSSQIRVYNLDGSSFAHSFQYEISTTLTNTLNVKAAYKYYNVQSTIDGELLSLPFVARDRFFFNMGYESKYEKWQADATLQWVGEKRLPNTSDKPQEFQIDSKSDSFVLVNAQVTRNFRWGSVYLGSENLLNYTQDNPIIDAENPFGEEFDASMVWAPVAGRMVYAGLRYKIKS